MQETFRKAYSKTVAVLLLAFANLTETRVTCEEGTSSEELLPSDWFWTHLWGVFLIDIVTGGPNSL